MGQASWYRLLIPGLEGRGKLISVRCRNPQLCSKSWTRKCSKCKIKKKYFEKERVPGPCSWMNLPEKKSSLLSYTDFPFQAIFYNQFSLFFETLPFSSLKIHFTCQHNKKHLRRDNRPFSLSAVTVDMQDEKISTWKP